MSVKSSPEEDTLTVGGFLYVTAALDGALSQMQRERVQTALRRKSGANRRVLDLRVRQLLGHHPFHR
eukprot:8412031-Lingulodinium_polyedra.AAC.1